MATPIAVGHDNGNIICFTHPDGSNAGTYVRQDGTFFGSEGTPLPYIAAIVSALDSHVLRQGGLV